MTTSRSQHQAVCDNKYWLLGDFVLFCFFLNSSVWVSLQNNHNQKTARPSAYGDSASQVQTQ
jgi:hypothetical protein